MRQPQKIKLNHDEYLQLTSTMKRSSTSPKSSERACLILLAQQGFSNTDIAELLNISRQKVARWRKRFMELGMTSIEKDATRPGGKEELPQHVVEKVLDISLTQKPDKGQFWTHKAVAKMCGISSSSVRRIWIKHGINAKQTVIKEDLVF